MQEQTQAASQAAEKKVKITYDEFQRLSMLIVGAVKHFERQGQESAPQSEIVNHVIQKIVSEEGTGTSVEKAAETAKRVANCINYLIKKENILLITQDSKVKNERLLCLNINHDIAQMSLGATQ